MGRPAFTPAELDRAVGVAQKRGWAVEIHRGVIRLVPGGAAPLASYEAEGEEECDAIDWAQK